MSRQGWAPTLLGYMPGQAAIGSTFNINGSTLAFAHTVFPRAADKLYNVWAFFSSITGSPTGAQTTCELQTDSSGTPSGTDVSGYSPVSCSNAPSTSLANNLFDFSATATTLTAFTNYWLVFKCSGGASNFVQARVWQLGSVFSGSYFQGGGVQSSSYATFNGSTWTANRQYLGPSRMRWGDGSYEGLPIIGSANTNGIAIINGSNEFGAKFTLPGTSGTQYSIAGITAYAQKNLTPAGFEICNLYLGNSTTPTATTGALGFNNMGSAVAYPLLFSSPVLASGGQTIRITVADNTSETGNNGYELFYNTMDTDINSLPLAPFEGTYQLTRLNSGAWTDTPGSLPFIQLLMDTTGEFSASTGGDDALIMIGNQAWW